MIQQYIIVTQSYGIKTSRIYEKKIPEDLKVKNVGAFNRSSLVDVVNSLTDEELEWLERIAVGDIV